MLYPTTLCRCNLYWVWCLRSTLLPFCCRVPILRIAERCSNPVTVWLCTAWVKRHRLHVNLWIIGEKMFWVFYFFFFWGGGCCLFFLNDTSIVLQDSWQQPCFLLVEVTCTCKSCFPLQVSEWLYVKFNFEGKKVNICVDDHFQETKHVVLYYGCSVFTS